MKKIWLYLITVLIISAFRSDDRRPIRFKDFKRGETFTYLAHYSFVNAGEAVVHLDENLHQINGKTCYKVDVDAYTIGAFAVANIIRDKWQSFIDTAEIVPVQFNRDITENNYRLIESSDFDHNKKKVVTLEHIDGRDKRKTSKIPAYTQDIVSGYYYIRTLDFERFNVGDTIKFDTFFENKVYNFKILYLGKEKVATAFGRINSFILSPLMPENQVFTGKNPLKIWVSDDANRIPLKVEAMLLIGALELELVNAKGLKSKLGKKAKT